MAHEHKDVLRERATPFVEKAREAGFEASVGSARGHMLKVPVERDGAFYGHALLYYKSSQDSFSLKGHEVNDEGVFEELEQLFRQSNPYDAEKHEGVHAYVDGSWMEGHGIGYGSVIIRDGDVVREEYGHVDPYQSMRQVVGELKAVIDVLEWLEEREIAVVTIHYDLEGIEKWVTGEHKARNALTKKYRHLVKDSPVKVQWHKVAGHSGVRGNERADALARQGAQLGSTEEEAEPEPDPMEELREVTASFLAYAREEGFADDEALALRDEGLFNDQYDRIIVTKEDDNKVGCIDLYNTSSRQLDPRIYGFDSEELQARARETWKQFRRQRDAEPEDELAEARYYYELFRPYRDERFDFIRWARAIERAGQHPGLPAASNVKTARYDFDALEEKFMALKEEA